MKLDFDVDQRFSCRQCGRCCRRGWDIALTAGEVDAYKRARAERWFREVEGAPEGAGADPFEPVEGHAGVLRIRKRKDGTCGFLSPENRCRIHEELGGPRKPLTCRVFPYRFHPAEGRAPLLTTSFSCPTVVDNAGAPVAEQAADLSGLHREWGRLFPEPAGPLLLAMERRIESAALGTVRRTLRALLERPGADGRPDLRENVARIGVLLDDWSRLRVLSLGDEALTEYLELTGSFAIRDEKPPQRRRASGLARLLFRGFVFAIVAARIQLENGHQGGLRLGLRWRLTRLLLRAHGVWPGNDDLDLGAARRATLDLDRPELFAIAHNYLRSSIETLGTGRRSVVDEAAVAVAFLQAGCVLAAVRAGRGGQEQVERDDLARGLMDAADLTHADPGTAYGGLLSTLSGGLESCFLFAEA